MDSGRQEGQPLVRIVVGLGSNLGDRLGHLQVALDAFRKAEGVEVMAWSRVYESQPVGEGLEGDFLNAVMVCDTNLTPMEVLALCREIEEMCGRDRKVENSTGIRNRTLDCDVIFFGEETIETPELVVPHPLWHERAFVVMPLMDVVEHLSPHQNGLVQNATKAMNELSGSCRRIEKMLD